MTPDKGLFSAVEEKYPQAKLNLRVQNVNDVNKSPPGFTVEMKKGELRESDSPSGCETHSDEKTRTLSGC